MKVEVHKAKAFEIDKSKEYLVTFESDVDIAKADLLKIKEQVLKQFTKMGVKATVLLTVKGRLQIAEAGDE